MDFILAPDFSGATSCGIGTLALTIGTAQKWTACDTSRTNRRADIAPTRTTISPWRRSTCRANSDRQPRLKSLRPQALVFVWSSPQQRADAAIHRRRLAEELLR